ncbi:MAG: DUF1592 domain-containing protein [Rhodospirillaceae bacterium]
MLAAGHSRFLRSFRAGVSACAAVAALASCQGADRATESHGQAAAPAKIAEAQVASTPRLRLMSAPQYTNTLANIFGPDLKFDTRFAPLVRTSGLLGNGAAVAGVSEAQLEQYQRTASLVAAEVTNATHRTFLIPCKPVDDKTADAACADKFLTGIGRLLYRHPLQQDQGAALVKAAGDAAVRFKDFYTGLSYVLEGMLMSPEMLLIPESAEPDPKHPGTQRLDSYSLATRLSLFLWNSAPDSRLLDASEHGELQTARGRAKVVDMMLASPRLETGVRAFFDDMFGFDDFQTLAKDSETYPFFTGATAADAREQTLRTIVDQLITQNGDYRDLFTTRKTFMSMTLAPVYGVPAATGWTPYEFPADSPRAGILSHVSFLAVHAHPGRSSPTLRGKALREILLCQPVPRPPANVDFSAVENPKSAIKTQRERVAMHLTNPVCAGCHKITDPIGLALENFDGAGKFRTTERGAPIDASGSLDGKDFKDLVGLSRALHDAPALTSCVVERTASYGLGGTLSEEKKPLLTYLNQRFGADGYRFKSLLRAIALSTAFSDVDRGGAETRTAFTATDNAPTK